MANILRYKFFIVPVFVTIGFLFFLKACTQKPKDPFYKVSDKKHLSLQDAVFEMSSSELIFVGEHHDNIHHHINQLQIIRELHEKSEIPIAIGLEMFANHDQEILDRWVNGQLAEYEFIKAFYRNWRQPWPLYRDILVYAKEHQIPLVALNVADEIVKKVAQEGFASLSTDDLSRLPSGITCNVTDRYEDFIERVFSWHGDRKDRSFVNFCEAQVLWDAAMAINLLQFQEKNRETRVVVLAGGGHAWKPGMPAQVLARKKVSFSVVLPESMDLHRRNVSEEETDYLWLWQMI